MARTSIKFSDDDLRRLGLAFDALAGPEKDRIVVRAVNRGGDAGFTAVRRVLSKEVGLPQRAIVSYGRMRKHKASVGNLNYEISSAGKALPLKLFSARQTKRGVSHKAWGGRTLNRGSFIVESLGGNVFHRAGKGRFPIKKEFGPIIPRELVKGTSKETLIKTAGPVVQRRVIHETNRLMDKYKARYSL